MLKRIMHFLSFLVIGLGVGWLSGLSVSPVIGTVLASLVGVAAGVVTGLKSVPADEGAARTLAVDARPAAILVLGVALGAPLGILARTHQVFAPEVAIPAGVVGGGAEAESVGVAGQAVLFGSTQDQCDSLRARARGGNEGAFRAVLAASGEWGRELEESVADTEALERIVLDLCRSE